MHPGLPFLAALAALGPGDGLSFDDALWRAGHTPAVVGVQQAAAVSQAAGEHIPFLTTNPQIQGHAGYRFFPAPERGLEAQLNLQQSFNVAGYGDRRRESARRESAVLATEARALLLEQQLAAARTWTTLWGATAAQHEAQQEVALATELLHRTERAAAAELVTQVDVAEARTYLSEAELQALALEGEVFELGIELATRVGATVDQPLAIKGPLPEPSVPPISAAQALARAAELPSVEARHRMQLAEGARERELKASRGTQLLTGVSVVREAPAAMYGLLTLGLTLPIFDRGERERAALLANQTRLAGETAALSIQARGELAQAFHEVTHSGEVLRQLREHLVPASAESVRLREASSRAGVTTVLELLLARRTAATARGRLARALAAHAFFRVRLALLLRALAAAGTNPSS